MKIGCIQLNVGFGKVEENFTRAEDKIREAAKLGQKLLCFRKCGIRATH